MTDPNPYRPPEHTGEPPRRNWRFSLKGIAVTIVGLAMVFLSDDLSLLMGGSLAPIYFVMGGVCLLTMFWASKIST